MPYAQVSIPGDGVTTLVPVEFALGAISPAMVRCYVTGELDGSGGQVYRTFTFTTSTLAQVDGAPAPVGESYIFERIVPKDELVVDWTDGDPITGENLDKMQKHSLHMTHEALDGVARSVKVGLGLSGPTLDDIEVGQTLVMGNDNTIVGVDTIGSGPGDMIRSIYDPQNIARDVFRRSNHVGLMATAIPNTVIPAPVLEVQTHGYSVFGRGAALYRNVAVEPTHAGKFQSQNGRWFEIADTVLTPDMFGAVADFNPETQVGTDNSAALQAWVTACGTLARRGRIPTGNYGYSTGLVTNADFVNFVGDGDTSCLHYTGAGIAFLTGNNRAVVVSTAATNNIRVGRTALALGTSTGIKPNDIILLKSTRAWYNDPRVIAAVTAGGISTTTAVGTTTSATLDAGFTVSGSIIGEYITFLSGPAAGYSRAILTYDNTTKVVTFAALPAAPGSGSRYVFAQCTKGQTVRVGRVITSTTVELWDSFADGYIVTDAAPENIKESVSALVYRPYTPILRDFAVRSYNSANTQCVTVMRALDAQIDVKATGGRNAGIIMSKCHGGHVTVRADQINAVSTGYGCQIWESSNVRVRAGTGWSNRRLVDVSGDAPSVRCVVSGLVVKGGGTVVDNSVYYPEGAVDNFGTGSHGAGHNTIYEDNYFEGVRYGIYERGRGAIIRDNTFGPKVQFPIYHSHGGRLEVYDNVADANVFSTPDLTTNDQEVGGSSQNARAAYAECFVTLGGNLINDNPYADIIVKDNYAAVQRYVVGFDIQGGGAKSLYGLQTYDNDVEFFPALVSDNCGLYGKPSTASAATVVVELGRHGDNRMMPLAGFSYPVIFGTQTTLSTQPSKPSEFGPGKWSVRMANNTAVDIPVAQNVREKLLVTVSVDEEEAGYFIGWIEKASTANRLIAGANYEILATKPNGSTGGTGVFQLYWNDGALTLSNRLNFVRTFHITVDSLG